MYVAPKLFLFHEYGPYQVYYKCYSPNAMNFYVVCLNGQRSQEFVCVHFPLVFPFFYRSMVSYPIIDHATLILFLYYFICIIFDQRFSLSSKDFYIPPCRSIIPYSLTKKLKFILSVPHLEAYNHLYIRSYGPFNYHHQQVN